MLSLSLERCSSLRTLSKVSSLSLTFLSFFLKLGTIRRDFHFLEWELSFRWVAGHQTTCSVLRLDQEKKHYINNPPEPHYPWLPVFNPQYNPHAFVLCPGLLEMIPTWNMSCLGENICHRFSALLSKSGCISSILVAQATTALNSSDPQRVGKKWIPFYLK